MADAAKQVCFVDMPFGKKSDPQTGQTIDFDQIYERGIKPAIKAAGLAAIRGDQESTGGIIHKAMFARLLLSEFVVADMTTANANVFYELGVRHTAKPQTTIPIFATLGAPPFDVNMVRAIPYDLTEGVLTSEQAAVLISMLTKRIRDALDNPVASDSPLFSLFPEFPGVEMSHELTDVFRDRVEYSEEFKTRLATARNIHPEEDARAALREIEGSFEDISVTERGVLVDLFISYRAVKGYDEMIALFERMPALTRDAAIVRQQLAFALNRRNQGDDRDQASSILEALVREQGASAESYGLLGRVYKDKYQDAKSAGSRRANGFLDLAIEAYSKGFDAEPIDFYPGINAITLLLQKGDEDSEKRAEKLVPLVTFAAARKGGATSNDYWTVATVLELSAIAGDFDISFKCLDRALALANNETWMLETTAANLRLILQRTKNAEDQLALNEIIEAIGESTSGH